MKKLNASVLAVLIAAIPAIASAEGAAKRVYECTYDGGRDASTWQPTGELEVPPAGAPTCIRLTDDYRCTKVIDQAGHELGDGMFCGLETQPEFPGLKAYEQ